ncbi:MAG: ABC transporter ATP-binding protein [Candidatus Thermoplasmatota archaeon]|nr:ABC transporter ATP-binding protein [Candidatus Thermoplasmatota archaeon]
MTEKEPVIKIRGLTKMYGDVVGIKDLDLDVYPGEVMGFLGPNGAGKTTTIRTCLGFLQKTEGDVKIFGKDSNRDSVEISKRTGYIPGDFDLYPDLKVKTVLNYLLSLSGTRSKEKMLDLAERFELDLEKKIKELSKGNRQKVGIVQAFMADQDLLILDEPTAGLDPLMQEEFYDLVREEKEKGKTIFMSSHILAEVEKICDRVAIIRDGTLQVVEHIEKLQDKVGKVMNVEFREEIDPSAFDIEGVKDIEREGSELEMIITHNIDEVIKEVSRHQIVNLNLETFSLDQLFLRFYSEGDEDDDG